MTKLSPAAGHDNLLPAQVQHSSHPGQGHSLNLVPDDDGVNFRCNGCKLHGAGARYECERGEACNHDLHIRCALAPPLREIGGNMFVLHHSPPDAGVCRRLCDACGGFATGFVYHCADLDHDVHPCCADLPETVNLGDGLLLELCMKDDDAPQRHCPICPDKKTWWGGRRRVKRGCWSYHSVRGRGEDDVFLHVACARDLACDSFTNVTGTGSAVVDTDQEMVTVKASALRALLLRRGNRGRGRWLRVLGIIVRAIIGVIFGDPTAMIVAVSQAIFSDDW